MKCPKCAYVRSEVDTAPNYECPACGIVYAKFDPDRVPVQRKQRRAVAANAPASVEAVADLSPAQAAAAAATPAQCPACSGTVAYGVRACPHCGKENLAPRPKPPAKPVGKVGITIAALGLLGFIAVLSTGSPTGGGASSSSVDPKLVQEAPLLIALAGYRCDRVDNMRQLLTKRGWSVQCNNYQYSYAITDEGGRLVVTLN